jgi:hypothetical protein
MPPPYNLRSKKSKGRWVKPPPDESDESSDDEFEFIVKKPEDKKNNSKKSEDKKKSKKSEELSSNETTSHQQNTNPRKKKKKTKGKNKKVTSKEKKEDTTNERHYESPLQAVIGRLMSKYVDDGPVQNEGIKIGMRFGDMVFDEDDEEDEDYDPDEDEEGEYTIISNGLMNLGSMMGSNSRNPYDIRLSPKKLTPELLEYLKTMPNIIGKSPKPGEDITEFKTLPKKKQKTIIKSVKQVSNIVENDEHPYFKILSLPIDATSKRTAMERQIAIMNAENSMMSEANPKARAWLRGFLDIPFGRYKTPHNRAKKNPSSYLKWSMEVMNKQVYGMNDAKDHILRYVAQMITNPRAAGNCLAFLGPPGTGKTSLIKNGLGKILNRPVHMIALGGNTDASVLEGHSYTYEGSIWGQIVDILIRSKCMNPVIIFDELDKVSGTAKGEEIIGLLTHITDSTQNSTFQDKYFAGINIDLSRVLFVFTLNNKDALNPVLMDRLRLVYTSGYSMKEKRIIGESYLLPRILTEYSIDKLNIDNSAWNWILGERKEEGVRNLKRDLETIVSRLNLLNLFKDSDEKDLPQGVPKGIKWKSGDMLNEDDTRILLGDRTKRDDKIPFGMFM